MNATRVLRTGHYQPMIKFIGKHRPPPNVSHAPHAHPAAPSENLPDSFATYRSKAQSHGPLGGSGSSSSSTPLQSSPYAASASAAGAVQASFGGQSQIAHGVIGGHSGRELGPIEPPQGVYMDRSQLPKRFGRLPWTEREMEAIESGGASLF